jgi:hypothetical protein
MSKKLQRNDKKMSKKWPKILKRVEGGGEEEEGDEGDL